MRHKQQQAVESINQGRRDLLKYAAQTAAVAGLAGSGALTGLSHAQIRKQPSHAPMALGF